MTINSLISLTDAGLQTATFSQIKAALIDEYRAIYGTDIDVDDTTADGVYINSLSLIINNIFETMQSMYANLDVRSSSGQYLDVLCALSNIERKQAIPSSAYVYLTYLGASSITYTVEQLLFVDKAGLEWQATEDCDFTSTNETKCIRLVCKKLGAVECSAGWITRLVDGTLLLSVEQKADGTQGADVEDDFALRRRQMSTGSGAGLTVINALKSALMNIAEIADVYIKENTSDKSEKLTDDCVLLPHSIYVIVRKQDAIKTTNDRLIGETIYQRLTPGITTCLAGGIAGSKKSYVHVEQLNGISSSVLEPQTVYWKEAIASTRTLDVTIDIYANYADTTSIAIRDKVIEYMNNLPMAYVPSPDEIANVVKSVDMLFKGGSTYGIEYVYLPTANWYSYNNYTACTITKNDTDKTVKFQFT